MRKLDPAWATSIIEGAKSGKPSRKPETRPTCAKPAVPIPNSDCPPIPCPAPRKVQPSRKVRPSRKPLVAWTPAIVAFGAFLAIGCCLCTTRQEGQEPSDKNVQIGSRRGSVLSIIVVGPTREHFSHRPSRDELVVPSSI